MGGERYAPMGHVMGAVIKTARWSGCACMLMVQRPANKALCPFQSRPAQRPYACSDQPQLWRRHTCLDDTLANRWPAPLLPAAGMSFGFPFCLTTGAGGINVRPTKRLPGVGPPYTDPKLNPGGSVINCDAREWAFGPPSWMPLDTRYMHCTLLRPCSGCRQHAVCAGALRPAWPCPLMNIASVRPLSQPAASPLQSRRSDPTSQPSACASTTGAGQRSRATAAAASALGLPACRPLRRVRPAAGNAGRVRAPFTNHHHRRSTLPCTWQGLSASSRLLQ